MKAQKNTKNTALNPHTPNSSSSSSSSSTYSFTDSQYDPNSKEPYKQKNSYLEYSKRSPEFKEAAYLLQLHLGTFEIETQTVQNIKSDHLEKRFNKYAEDEETTIHHSVVSISDLTGQNKLQNVLKRGFDIPTDGGILMPCGYIPLGIREGELCKALVCKVAVKRALKLANGEVDSGSIERVAEGKVYDSICVKNDGGKDGKGKKVHPFKTDMVLFKKKQILPLYLAEFTYKKNSTGVSKLAQFNVICV